MIISLWWPPQFQLIKTHQKSSNHYRRKYILIASKVQLIHFPLSVHSGMNLFRCFRWLGHSTVFHFLVCLFFSVTRVCVCYVLHYSIDLHTWHLADISYNFTGVRSRSVLMDRVQMKTGILFRMDLKSINLPVLFCFGVECGKLKRELVPATPLRLSSIVHFTPPRKFLVSFENMRSRPRIGVCTMSKWAQS